MSVVTYASPVWHCLLSDKSKSDIEKIQKAATKVILPEVNYSSRLELLGLTTLNEVLVNHSMIHFSKIAINSEHPLNKSIIKNNSTVPVPKITVPYRPSKYRTGKRQRNFFIHHMNFFNNCFLSDYLFSFVTFQYYHFMIHEMKNKQ